jgi:hypothetical protein
MVLLDQQLALPDQQLVLPIATTEADLGGYDLDGVPPGDGLALRHKSGRRRDLLAGSRSVMSSVCGNCGGQQHSTRRYSRSFANKRSSKRGDTAPTIVNQRHRRRLATAS